MAEIYIEVDYERFPYLDIEGAKQGSREIFKSNPSTNVDSRSNMFHAYNVAGFHIYAAGELLPPARLQTGREIRHFDCRHENASTSRISVLFGGEVVFRYNPRETEPRTIFNINSDSCHVYNEAGFDIVVAGQLQEISGRNRRYYDYNHGEGMGVSRITPNGNRGIFTYYPSGIMPPEETRTQRKKRVPSKKQTRNGGRGR